MKKVLIIGGGIVGQFTAYYLAKNNFSVTIVDDAPTMPPASEGNCGLITPSHILPMNSLSTLWTGLKWLGRKDAPLSIKPQLDLKFISWFVSFMRFTNSSSIAKISQARHELLQLSSRMYSEFFKNEGQGVEFRNEGLVYACKTKKGVEHVKHEKEAQDKMGLKATMLSKNELRNLEPVLNEEVIGGAIFNVDGWIDPKLLLTEIKKINELNGVVSVSGRVTDFEFSGRKIKKVKTKEGNLDADEFILCAGAFSSDFASKLGLSIPIIPGKGYNLTSNVTIANQPSRPIYMFEKRVVATPWKDGFRLGSTMEFSGFDLSLNQRRLNALKESCLSYMDLNFDDVEFKPWTGFRPMTPDSLPIIRKSEKHDNLILATGHGMLGLTWAPASGFMVNQIISNEN